MSKPDDLIIIGAIAGAHGVKGQARIKPFGDPDALCDYGSFLNENGEAILNPVSARPGPNNLVVVSFAETLTRESVQALKGTKLYIARTALPKLEDDEFYYKDLIGLRVEDLTGAPLGKVKSVQDFGAGDLLEISGPTGVSLHPFTKDSVPHIDLKTGRLTLDPMPVDESEESDAPQQP